MPSLNTPHTAFGQCEHRRAAICQTTQQKNCLDTIDDMRVLDLEHIFAKTVGSYQSRCARALKQALIAPTWLLVALVGGRGVWYGIPKKIYAPPL